MDQGAKETSVEPSFAEKVKERYEKLRDSYLQDITLLDGLLWEAESQGSKKADNFVARAVPTRHLMKIDQQRNKMLLEWVKLAFEEEEVRLETALKALNDFVKRYGPMLEKIEAERADLSRRVQSYGPR